MRSFWSWLTTDCIRVFGIPGFYHPDLGVKLLPARAGGPLSQRALLTDPLYSFRSRKLPILGASLAGAIHLRGSMWRRENRLHPQIGPPGLAREPARGAGRRERGHNTSSTTTDGLSDHSTVVLDTADCHSWRKSQLHSERIRQGGKNGEV